MSFGVNKIYDIKERTFLFSKQIILFVKDTNFDRTFSSIFDQLVRSATSVGANIAEGKSGSSKNDFLKFHIIALKSANETIYWLKLIRETLNIDKNKADSLMLEVEEIAKILATIILKNKAA
ncbi:MULTISPECIES: four helix bundle protein [Olivibacter]|uniref:Four helix bundle protein n=2 Tax=Olivibacter TaxID=376469 RepID=A0ABV6HHP6_9SPHI|nr:MULTISPECIES: four helix bundle protein [unclassified Olivibacter]MCL4640201.1 four helix bundle protein [Olivibacter sp. UJ_SKK_5.1]MDM8176579.1 four helix bundle protein [Olivibacter sp. 47]MDX3915963.1 four helix bundle protein [Pseudosphingobacterium sp.]QEL00840.1 four helix bundle protein [Olivibacter sp. LS-1]